jgi:lipoyl(octanoyl) transferase
VPFCYLFCPGQVPYLEALQWQRALVRERKANPALPDTLLLLEHPPVYTLGQGASLEFLKFEAKLDTKLDTKFAAQATYPEIHRIERGGEVTYHCPGQLVGYPILNLNRHQPDLHWYLRQLEQVLIEVVGLYGLKGERIEGLTGVWIEGHKVAAIGIKVSRWITMHGFSLNVHPDMTGFKRIVPCGIADRPVAALQDFCPTIAEGKPKTIEFQEVQGQVAKVFAEIFQLKLITLTDLADTVRNDSDDRTCHLKPC